MLKNIQTKPYLKNHIEILHSTSNKLNCSECLKKFSGKLYLTSHIKLVHSKLENGQVFQINIILGNYDDAIKASSENKTRIKMVKTPKNVKQYSTQIDMKKDSFEISRYGTLQLKCKYV